MRSRTWATVVAGLAGLLGFGAAAPVAFGQAAAPAASARPTRTAEAKAPPMLSLAEAVQRALAKNPTLASARADIDRAEGVMRSTRAPALPTLSANGTYTRLDGDRVLAGTPGTTARVIAGQNQLFGNVLLTVPIVNAAAWLQWGQASDNVEVARATANDARRTLGVAVGRAYLSVVAAHRLVEASEQAVKTSREHSDFAKRRFGGGLGNRIDQVRADQEVAVSESQLEQAESVLARAQESLGVLVAEEGPLDAGGDLPSPALPQPATAEREALQRREDVKAAEGRARLAERVQKESWAEFLPTLVGNLMPFYQDPPTLTNPQTGWQAQLLVTLPLYDGGARYGRIDQRKALAEQGRLALEGVRRQALSDVRVSFVTLDRADGSLEATRRSEDLSREALRLTSLAYEAGAATNLELIDAERRLRDAQIAVAVAENAARQARLDLLAACGLFP